MFFGGCTVRINLLYNKIVADTVKEGFIESFNTTALPILSEKYPNAEEVVIYEDYLSDGLFQAGTFFCPLTIVSEGSLSRAFASWRYDSKKFEDAIPYSYIGKDILDIALDSLLHRLICIKLIMLCRNYNSVDSYRLVIV